MEESVPGLSGWCADGHSLAASSHGLLSAHALLMSLPLFLKIKLN